MGQRDPEDGLGFFRPGGARPQTEEMIAYIDDHKDRCGVESICAVLPIAPSTYYENKAREVDPDRLPSRVQRDEALKAEIRRIWEENFRVYGTRKVWSYDNAQEETINGLYKAEVIYRRGRWKNLEAVEYVTLEGWTGSTTGG